MEDIGKDPDAAEEARAWLALALCSSGRPDSWLALARNCGGALECMRASDEELASHGASPAAVSMLRLAWTETSGRVGERCRKLGIEIATPGSPFYPQALWDIADPPLALFWRGASPASLAPCVAVVGARRCTEYGQRTAGVLGREAAAAGIVVVSGLARGIDAAAHRGALETGRTAAVLAGGLDQIYPGEHRSLAERVISSGGFLLAEQPPGVRPLPWLFPFRNRIITGLSLATVVVEASRRSGSLASARHALDQGREVFAVPGPIDSSRSEGSNALLAQGANPYCRLDDLSIVGRLADLVKVTNRKSSKATTADLASLDPQSAAVLMAIQQGAATADEIGARTALDGTRVLSLLTALELDGRIERGAHGRFRGS